MHYKFGKPAPFEVVAWSLVEATGWTLEYINGLPLAKVHEWLKIQDARMKARQR